jgi:hypothetical protein
MFELVVWYEMNEIEYSLFGFDIDFWCPTLFLAHLSNLSKYSVIYLSSGHPHKTPNHVLFL